MRADFGRSSRDISAARRIHTGATNSRLLITYSSHRLMGAIMNGRIAAAACLTASPLLVSLSHFLWPAHSEGTSREQLTSAGTHSGGWAAATLVETVGWMLLVPAFLIIWSEVRGRGRVLTSIGVWCSIAGLFGYYGAGVMNLITVELGRQHHDATMVGLTQA